MTTNSIGFTVSVAEAVNKGFSFTKFLESMGYFYFEHYESWTRDGDYDLWIQIKKRRVTTTYYNDVEKPVINSYPLPKNINDALHIFDSGYWSQYSKTELSQEEAEAIALKYSQYLLTGIYKP